MGPQGPAGTSAPAGTIIFLDVSMSAPSGYSLIGTVSVEVKVDERTLPTSARGALPVSNGNGHGAKHVTLNMFRKN